MDAPESPKCPKPLQFRPKLISALHLTATPKRKDRLEPLLYAQCGPIRYTLWTPRFPGRER